MYTIDEAKREALRQTERQLEGQQTLAIASDQRAMAFCSLMVVSLTLLAALSGNFESKWMLMIALVLLTVSAAVSAFAAFPQRFYGSGGRYKGFTPYFSAEYAAHLIDQIGTRNDEYIQHNESVIRRSTRLFRISLAFALAGFLLLIWDGSRTTDEQGPLGSEVSLP